MSNKASGVTLECSDVSHRFPSSAAWVLKEISLQIARGEFVAFVGASGCGKTTLLRILAGLLHPTRGVVRVGDQYVTGIPANGRAIVFQGDRLFPWRTALQNTLFGLEVRKVPHATAVVRAAAMLKLVGLERALNAYPSELSGGMRQRVNVARALVVDPDFLLMDEPFAALDAQTRELMQQELLRILGQTMVGVAFVTHQIEEALYLADRVVVLGVGPGRIRDEVRVPFPRPRLPEVRRDLHFQQLYTHIWKLIESDVVASVFPEGEAAGAAGL